jgi:hypothetical protein
MHAATAHLNARATVRVQDRLVDVTMLNHIVETVGTL